MEQNELSTSMKAFTAREFAGEKIIWVDKPDGKIFVLKSFAIWLFAIPWTAFAIFWEYNIVGPLFLDLLGFEVSGQKPSNDIKNGMWAMAMFGLPFLVIGFAMLLTPLWLHFRFLRTLFVLTNKRIAILNDGRKITISSIRPPQIFSTSRKEGPDGRGTLILHEGYTRDSDGDRVEKTTTIGVINNVRQVEQMVIAMKAKAER